jgi:N-acetylglucosaminyldiphosphoundecaprenol N-acetyl-beta-D-mannosaminyltransferase
MKLKKENINRNIISFLIVTITLFGSLSFIINKDTIDQLINYYIIGISGLAIIALFINNIKEFSLKRLRKIPLVLTMLSMIWLLLTIIMGIRINTETLKGLINMGCLLFLGYTIINIKLTTEDKKYIKKSIYASFVICILIGIFQYFSGINLIKYSNDLYPGILGRINSTFYIATILDKYIVLVSALLLYDMIKNPHSKTYKIIYLLAGIGISLTFSRGGQLVFLFISGLIVLLAIFKKQISNILAIIFTIFIMVLIPGTTDSIQSGLDFVYQTLNFPNQMRIQVTKINDYTDKFFDFFKQKTKDPINKNEENNSDDNKDDTNKEPINKPIVNQSISYRDNYKRIGLELIKKHPIFGIGIGNYSYLVNSQTFSEYIEDQSVLNFANYYMYPHNTYIHTMAETGIIGLILIFATIFSYIIYSNFKNDKLQSFTTLVLMIALLLAGYTEGVLHSKQYIFIFMLFIAVLNAKNKKEQKESSNFNNLFEKLYKGSKEEYLKRIQNNVKKEVKTFIVTANPEAFMLAEKKEEYMKLLLDQNTEIIPDGIGLVKAGRILGYDIIERIPGIDIAQFLLEYANNNKKSVYLFGSKKEVIEKMKELIAEKYQNIKLVGATDGYVKDKDKVMKDIVKNKPDIALIALGMPIQEELIYKYINEFEKGVFVGVGGSLDVISGMKKRAPKIFIKLNIEWLYRIAKEPKRIKRFYNNNIKFLFKLK